MEHGDDPRTLILAELERAPQGLGAAELGRWLGLHANTVRWHLGVLARDGLVASAPEQRSTPGRPRILYRTGPVRRRRPQDEYRLLATVLADTISRTGRAAAACEAAGRAWGADLVGRRGAPSESPVGEVVSLLADQGFEPEAGEQAILMHRCPFHDLAETQPEVVCSVHRGVISGALGELGSPLRVGALDIFPQPGVCVAHLT